MKKGPNETGTIQKPLFLYSAALLRASRRRRQSESLNRELEADFCRKHPSAIRYTNSHFC